jgi:hypothetical protein
MWFGFWGADADAYGSSSLYWDGPVDDATIESQGGGGMRFMYQATKIFCQEQQVSGQCTLFSDFQARWDAAVPKLAQYLKESKILGFFVGDEQICRTKSAVAGWTTIANTMRNSFPRNTAIIWGNECGSTFGDSDKKAVVDKVPDAFDWISIDHYRSDKSGDFVNDLKDMYNKYIYPKLQSHQKVAVIPQVGHPKDNFKICDDKCTASIELQDAKDVLSWARGDSRVTMIAPYRWSASGKETGLKQMTDADALKGFWFDFGKGTKSEKVMSDGSNASQV